MQAFLEAWLATGREEGGFANNPKDSGGPTNFGISERVARANGYTGDMLSLPRELARAIAKAQYWDLLRLDEIAALSVPIAKELFDSGFLCGQATVAQWLQRCLNVGNRGTRDYQDIRADGLIGALTVDALGFFLKRSRDSERVLLNALNGLQSAHFTTLAERREKDEEFWFGWQLNRVRIST